MIKISVYRSRIVRLHRECIAVLSPSQTTSPSIRFISYWFLYAYSFIIHSIFHVSCTVLILSPSRIKTFTPPTLARADYSLYCIMFHSIQGTVLTIHLSFLSLPLPSSLPLPQPLAHFHIFGLATIKYYPPPLSSNLNDVQYYMDPKRSTQRPMIWSIYSDWTTKKPLPVFSHPFFIHKFQRICFSYTFFATKCVSNSE